MHLRSWKLSMMKLFYFRKNLHLRCKPFTLSKKAPSITYIWQRPKYVSDEYDDVFLPVTLHRVSPTTNEFLQSSWNFISTSLSVEIYLALVSSVFASYDFRHFAKILFHWRLKFVTFNQRILQEPSFVNRIRFPLSITYTEGNAERLTFYSPK